MQDEVDELMALGGLMKQRVDQAVVEGVVRLEGRLGREQNAHGVGAQLRDRDEQAQARLAVHRVVADDDVDGARAQHLARLDGVGGRKHLGPTAERALEGAAHQLVVVDDEHPEATSWGLRGGHGFISRPEGVAAPRHAETARVCWRVSKARSDSTIYLSTRAT